jgi:hypothetical protein
MKKISQSEKVISKLQNESLIIEKRLIQIQKLRSRLIKQKISKCSYAFTSD